MVLVIYHNRKTHIHIQHLDWKIEFKGIQFPAFILLNMHCIRKIKLMGWGGGRGGEGSWKANKKLKVEVGKMILASSFAANLFRVS